ncbi:39S ribosomal protein L47, mitochondrial [Lucilia cuprina]|uniref:39S ribosomal protein L47, mitochondrial n=1 Tax=Lucilia cuprina TaxID=7375 RepID=UPI001F06E536|nr:39S ribosomal protein L47, mitochondrial [Lucilia cuprina]
MSGITKVINVTQSVRNLCYTIGNLSLQQAQKNSTKLLKAPQCLQTSIAPLAATTVSRQFSTTPRRNDLMQFFDDPKNWNENEVKVGRAWKLDELRIKSNKELHQLWYVLLKERNMLLTMEHECNDQMELFPSPDRLDKVKISMENLETVVRERNKAYHLLETGETGERPKKLVANKLGINFMYKYCEHVLPPQMNVKWIKSRSLGYGGRAVRKFLLQYREKLYNEKRKAKNRSRNEAMMLLRRNPHMDRDLLRRKFPGVDIDKLVNTDKIRGHYIPKVQS